MTKVKTIDVEAKEVAQPKQQANLKQKIAIARQIIAETPMRKDGKNKFSNYDYFTPAQVEQLVQDASNKVGILCCYNLEQDPLGGYMASVVVHDLESDHALVFKLATAKPEIKATNEAQKLGGMMTYSQRYLKMSIFGIADNNLDFDSQDNRAPKAAPKVPNIKAVAMTVKQKDAMLQFIKDGKGELIKPKLVNYIDDTNKKAVLKALKGE